MTWTDFYSEPDHLGNLFGIRGPFYGRRGHLGVDWNGHRSGTPIPSWTDGTVVTSVRYLGLGWTVIIRRPDGTFAGFCHMREKSPLAIGARVAVGQTIGVVGNTGALSTGPHLHATLEPSATIGTQNAFDPLPHIRAAIRSAQTPIRKEYNMPYLVPLVVGNPPTPNGDYAIIGDGGIVGLRAKEDAAIISIAKRAMLDGEPIYGNQGDQLQALFARVAVKVPAQPAPVIDYPKLAAELAKLLRVPTAAENGAAARAAIVRP